MIAGVAAMPEAKRPRDATEEPDEEPSAKRTRQEHSVPGLPRVSTERLAESARIDDVSRELLASIDKEGFVASAQLEHDGSSSKKNKNTEWEIALK